MGESTAGTEAMRVIISAVHPYLKDAGFRKRRHGFNRAVEEDLIHVVHFQRGQKPGLYDLFTINLGVFLPEAFVLMRPDWKTPAFINEFDCQIRQRIGFVIGDRDTWWDLETEEPHDLADAMRDDIMPAALDWLDERAPSRSSLLDFYERNPQPWSLIALAVVAAERGEHDRASRFMQTELERIASMERSTQHEVDLHLGWIAQMRMQYIDHYELDVTYPKIGLTPGG